MGSANFPSRPFTLFTDYSLNWQDGPGGNRSSVHCNVRVHKNSYSPSFNGSGSSGYYDANGQRLWTNANFGYDIRNTDDIILASVDFIVYHDANGYGSFGAYASVNLDPGGYAEISETIGLSRIAQTPTAPTPIGIDQITSSGMRYRFSGGDPRGATMDQHQVQYGTDAAYTGGGVVLSSDGNTTVSGLNPGTTYFWRSRSHNAAGWGDWSANSSATTLGNAPSAPQNLVQSAVPPSQINLSWSAPSSNGGKAISGYTAQVSTDPGFNTGVTQNDLAAGATSTSFTGLSPGQTYYSRVRANNADAQGAWANAQGQIPAGGKVWTGSVWKSALCKVWTGSVWKVAIVKVWTGSIWKVAK